MVQRYPNGKSNAEDQCQRVTYSYDTNPYNSSYSQYATGRLTAAIYGPTNSSGGSCIPGVPARTYYEMYSYHPAGAVTGKSLAWGLGVVAQVSYTYDSAGRTSTVTYPMAAPFGSGSYTAGPVTFTYGYSYGKPSSLRDSNGWTWAQNPQYDYAGRLTSLQYLAGAGTYTTQSLGYNVNSQLASIGWTTPTGYGPTGTIQYSYSATQNNGQITQVNDGVSGETVVYQYDALKRLISATSNPNSGSTPATWTQTFQYDGFGNLTAKVLNGTTMPIAVNAATNQLSNALYDLNGNMTSGAGATITYDEANRMSSAAETSGGTEYYYYAPDNKRIYRLNVNGSTQTEEWTFYGARGERLGVYSMGPSGLTPVRTNVYFAGRPILDTNNAVFSDRTGTNRANGARFYPYGDEITSTANDRMKFATYTRDSYTTLDYADQRFYASTYGRFNTPDPATASAGPQDPASWNRYSYTGGDPVNRLDPRGTDWIYEDDGGWCSTLDSSGDCYGPEVYDTGCLENPVACAMEYSGIYAAAQGGGGGGAGAGDGGGGGGSAAPLTACEVELFTRPVANTLGLGTHSYLEVWGSTGVEDTLEGGPTNSSSLFPGLLRSFDTVDGFAFSDDVPATAQGGLNPISCAQANAVIQDDDNFKTTSTYNLLGPNSNSFLNWLITTGGLSSLYPTAPPGSVGWNTPVQPVSQVSPGKSPPPGIPGGLLNRLH